MDTQRGLDFRRVYKLLLASNIFLQMWISNAPFFQQVKLPPKQVLQSKFEVKIMICVVFNFHIKKVDD